MGILVQNWRGGKERALPHRSNEASGSGRRSRPLQTHDHRPIVRILWHRMRRRHGRERPQGNASAEANDYVGSHAVIMRRRDEKSKTPVVSHGGFEKAGNNLL